MSGSAPAHARGSPRRRRGELRPKADGRPATFYTLVSAETREQEFAKKRQLFLTEQGYAYEIVAAANLMAAHREERA